MKIGLGTIVSRYARALFAAAVETKQIDAVRRDLKSLHELWQEQPELKLLLMNPGLSRKKVKAILNSLEDKLAVSDVMRRFVDLVLEKDRLNILDDIQPVFEKLLLAHEGKIEVRVTTAVPVDEPLQKQIETHLRKSSGKEPMVSWQQNPALLGGLVIEWPDHVFDGSLSRKIQNMQVELAGRV